MTSWKIDNFVRRKNSTVLTDEYNCKLWRLFPWQDKVNTKREISEFGCMWLSLVSGKKVDPHTHDEEEAFIVIAGEAELTLNNQKIILTKGDCVYIPRFFEHSLSNAGHHDFEVIDIYWDLGSEGYSQ